MSDRLHRPHWRDILSQPPRKPLAPRCEFCLRDITSLGDCLVLNDKFERYPKAFFAHARCIDEHDPIPLTYGIHLKRIVREGSVEFPHAESDSLAMWREHLKTKPWVTWAMIEALGDAHGLALRLKAPPKAPSTKEPKTPTLSAAPARRVRPAIPSGARARVLERDGFRCRRCGAYARDEGVRLVVDHIVPVSRGGSSDDSNLQSLCRDCNAGKGARDPHPQDFIQ